MLSFNAFNPTTLIATAALGPAGGIAAQLASQVFSKVGQQMIQQMGQNLGLPQSAIDVAQASFAGSHGDIQGLAGNLTQGVEGAIEEAGLASGASPHDIADQQRATQDFIRDTLDRMGQSDEFKDAKASRGKSGSAGGQGWLMAMAKVLGSQLDQLGDQMTSMSKRITKDTPGLTAEFGVVSQQFNMLMNATSTAIKTVGEAMGRMASKQ
ncbi:hypothetical protein ASG29_02400 [Sphingomonas sp. Leaf412]|uniref:hypothetical protein n=1 Tax=Sphingomonas sp. Leaf412 TaxID=1736370 RepID=UPI0006FB7275|nr:hypothetical protein [Sphingomonas sp. Leaf412]KQT35005.1 hypothetical protein ASG29_02400 [Sphingomonas sp. Leaf412]